MPGGFAYGDYLRSGAVAKFSPIMDYVRKFADRGKLIIGICNGFQVMVKGRKKINARAGEPLMISLERVGIVIPASCRSGECSLCRTKLLSGKVFQPPGAKLRKSDRTYGYIHPCVAYPLENLEIMVF